MCKDHEVEDDIISVRNSIGTKGKVVKMISER
jgi:hypothetical protein